MQVFAHRATVAAADATSGLPAEGAIKRGSSRAGALALAAVQLTAWLVLVWASLSQHAAFNTNAFDLSWFDQLAWNTAHGRWFQTSFLPYSFLGNHFEPVLLPIALVYRVAPSAQSLLVVQATAVVVAAVPLYLGVRRLLDSTPAALSVAASYLLAPQLHRAVLFDFHPELLVVLSTFSAFACLVYGRPGWSCVAIASAFLLKEDAFFIVGAFGLVMWLQGYRRHTIGLAAVSIAYALLVVAGLMPHLRHGYGGETWRYGYLRPGGQNLSEWAGAVLRLLPSHLLGADQLHGLAKLVGSLALLPLLAPEAAGVLPLLLAHLLSTHQPQRSLDFQYAIAPLALAFVATAFSLRRLASSRRLHRVTRLTRVPAERSGLVLAGALLVTEAVAFVLASPLGLRYDPALYQQSPHTHIVARILSQIPTNSAVSAQTGLLPHLSERRAIHEFPDLGDAGFVVVDVHTRRSSQSVAAGFDALLANLPAKGYCIVYEEDGVKLYSREACS